MRRRVLWSLLALAAGCGRGTLDLSGDEQESVNVPPDSGNVTVLPSGAPDAGRDASVPSISTPQASTPSPSNTGLPPNSDPDVAFPDAGGPFCWEQGQSCGPGRPYCDFRTGRCAECLSSVHCRGGEVCDEAIGLCVPGCYSDRDCAEIDQECDFFTNLCVECTSSFHCAEVYGPGRSVCADSRCYPCNEFLRCPGNLVCDDGRCEYLGPSGSSGSGMSSTPPAGSDGSEDTPESNQSSEEEEDDSQPGESGGAMGASVDASMDPEEAGIRRDAAADSGPLRDSGSR